MELTFNSFTPLYMEDVTPARDDYECLWHYTNLNGLLGILPEPSKKKDVTFWFTRSDCLNDMSEGQDVIHWLNAVGNALYEQEQIDYTFYEATQNRVVPKRKLISYPYRDTTIPQEEYQEGAIVDIVECEAFLCCFSTAGDQLDMWRYYAKTEDGYALSFDTSIIFHDQEDYRFADKVDPSVQFSSIKRLDVLYDSDEKRIFLETLLLKAYESYQKETESKGPESALKSVNMYLDYVIQENQYRFKHSCFRNENEYRFVAYRPVVKPKRMANDLAEVRYRSQNGALVPYVEIPGWSHALRKIQISPYVKTDFAEDSLKNYLQSIGLGHIRVSRSELPVRF